MLRLIAAALACLAAASALAESLPQLEIAQPGPLLKCRIVHPSNLRYFALYDLRAAASKYPDYVLRFFEGFDLVPRGSISVALDSKNKDPEIVAFQSADRVYQVRIGVGSRSGSFGYTADRGLSWGGIVCQANSQALRNL
jgi:hypothetical protein